MTKRDARPVIRMRGVRHNNLKNFDLDLPANRLVVLTGLSGSGKSSLAFDTLFAEGQRRYIETFSPYARQFFDRMDKPQVDRIEGIPPAIAVEQTNQVRTTRSTVGTMTELCDYMKLLWPRLARLHCRQCGRPVVKDSPQSVWNSLPSVLSHSNLGLPEVLVTFDLPLSEKLSLGESLTLISKQGYQRILLNGNLLRLEDATAPLAALDPAPTALTVIQDRLRPIPELRARFVEACEQAFHFGKGKLAVRPLASASSVLPPQSYSKGLHCAFCDLEYREPSPALFSFNHPLGACPACRGFGRVISIDYNLALPDRSKTLAEGVVKPWQTGQGAECQQDLLKFCQRFKVPTNVPFNRLPTPWRDWVVNGDPDYGRDARHEWPRAWYGVKGYFRWLESKAYKMHVRVLLSRYRAYSPCPDCHGQRFQPESLLFKLKLDQPKPAARPAVLLPADSVAAELPASITLADFYSLPVNLALGVVERIANQETLGPSDPVGIILHEVRSRLAYLVEVGLGYLTLERPTRTLSGGETERVNLTTCLGSRLVNTLFVLDEPTVGLHARDTRRLVRVLQNLRDAGNTVVVVEHEDAVMRAADQIVDLGPGQGEAGGNVVFQGTLDQLLKHPASLTGQYLSGARQAAVRRHRLIDPATPKLVLSGAARHNLKNLTVAFPLNRFVCLTGVSGSGKTTLAREVLLPALETALKAEPARRKASARLDENTEAEPESEPDAETPCSGGQTVLEGAEHLARVILVDQSPLGRTPRSNPAVYVGAFDHIRELFAQTDLARQRGLKASAFSFNSRQGQCERCRGAGFEKIEMQFLSDVFIRCPDCDGRRYRPHILEILLPVASPDGKADPSPIPMPRRSISPGAWSIADLLEATVDQTVSALLPYVPNSAGRRALESLKQLQEVGLGYLRLGQPVNTLSGGESQRLKLATYLAECAGTDSRRSVSGAATRPGRSQGTAPPATLFIFDEPTTGLHFQDVQVLLQAFQRLIEAGHSLLVIEHNLDVIQSADWVADLGPEGGEGGGRLVVEGSPEEVALCPESHTGRYLAAGLSRRSYPPAPSGHPDPESVLAERPYPSPEVPTEPAPAADGRFVSERNALSMVRPSERTLPPSAFFDRIDIRGAREHNLKNISLTVPRNRFVVVTGVSGSGKSTLAFDLLFAEGQRRFLDSMNTYARQFVEQMARPDVDLIAGIPPTVSIEQRTTRGGGKSTVATVTEVYHFLRLLFARLGKPYCPDCRRPVEAQTRDQLGRHLQREMKRRGDLLLLAPVVKNRKGFHTDVAEWAARHGYREIRADGKIYDTSRPFRLDRFREHDVEIVVGVLERKKRRHAPGGPTEQQRIDQALKLGRGTLCALDNDRRLTLHSTERACPSCGRSFPPLDPKMFSYNSAQGWCATCRGFGELFYLPEVERGALADAIEESWFGWQEGNREICPDCQGARINPVARAVRLDLAGLPSRSSIPHPTITDFSEMAVAAAWSYFGKLKLKGRAALIARDIMPEIQERLKFLDEVGLGYLQLGRGVTTLSGGEAQRIRLAAQLGSNLSGVLYVLDEPTIGLHARDNEHLLAALAKLRARGNSLVVVEHDEETMRRADHIIDLGPGAGIHGGEVVASGTLRELLRHKESITGQCLRAEKCFPSRGQRRPVPDAAASPRIVPPRPRSSKATRRNESSSSPAPTVFPGWLTLGGAALNNLKDLTVTFPLGRLVLVTGVSGSGKSTLVRECLLPALTEAIKRKRRAPSRSLNLSGYESVQAVYEVDQSPIGRTPRSIPATYVGFFNEIRRLFAVRPEARLRGYGPGRFSFNSKEGRCPQCEGAGTVKLEMNFLPPAYVRCESCRGLRFTRETLDIEYGGKTIAQVLEMSVEEALEFFAGVPKIRRPLQALHDTGLDYLKLGQTSPTLSGGEAQRVKLVTHLLSGLKESPDRFGPNPKRNLFLLEEPTIGLHMADVRRLVDVLQRLVDAGHTVVVIEHNLDLIAEADWIIDLGPEGGEAGGRIVAEGPPEAVARHPRSHTGRFLRTVLRKSTRAAAPAKARP
jgi:excinuclease ABC subunit A